MKTDYTFRRFQAEDAPAISACVTKIHGRAYPRVELYTPETIVHRNATGAWVSFVAADGHGHVVGHLALELSGNGPVAELGMGMVLAEHRQRRLVERLRDVVVEESRALGVAGQLVEIAIDNAAAQVITNRSPTRPCGLTLGLWPADVPGEARARRSFVRYFRYFRAPVCAIAHAPPRHHDMLARIYAELGAPVALRQGAPPAGRDRMTVERRPTWQSTFITVQEVGTGSAAALSEAHRTFLEDPTMASAYLELPLAQPGAAEACEHAEQLGFFFSGVAPYGVRDGDALRLQYLKEAPQIVPAEVIHPFARALLGYITGSWRLSAP